MLLDTENNVFIEPNDLGCMIIEYIKNNAQLDTNVLAKEIANEYDEDINIIKNDIVEFVDELINQGIIVN